MEDVKNVARPQLEPMLAGANFKVLKVTAPSGAVMPTHHATSEAVICVYAGEVQLIIGNESHKLTKGSTFLLPAGKDHSLKVVNAFEARVIMTNDGEIKF